MAEPVHSNEGVQNTVPVGDEGDPFILGGGDTGAGGIAVADDDDEDAPMVSPAREPKEEDYDADEETPQTTDKYKGLSVEDFGGGLKGEEGKKKEEVKTEEEVKPGVEPEQEVLDTEKVGVRTTKDFSGFDEADIPKLKRMSKITFDWLKPQLLEAKELKARVIPDLQKKIQDLQTGKTVLPEQYYEHPEAYMLHPDYRQAELSAERISVISDHFQQQLAKVEAGEDWQDLTEQNGQLIPTEPKPASPAAKAKLYQFLIRSESELRAANAKLESMREGFKTKHQQEIQQIVDVENKYFPGYDDDKHPTKAIQQKVLGMLPPTFRSHPLGRVVAKLAAANSIVRQKYEKAEQELKAAKGTKLDAKLAGPKPKDTVKGPARNGSAITYEKFLQAKEQ